MTKPQIVILSSIEWDAAWQRHQVFASQWAAAGHDVFFVENTGWRNPGLADLPRLWRRLAGDAAPRRNPPPPNLRLITPLVLPPTLSIFRRLNTLLWAPRLADRLHGLGLKSAPWVIAYLPTSTILDILDALQPALTVYDCVDNFHGLASAPRDLAAVEKALLSRSDLVLTTSPTLFEDKAKLHPNVMELHHGVSLDFFLPQRPRNGYQRLCYFGTLWKAIDYAPIRALAEAGFTVDLIGPRKQAPPRLPPGVTWRQPVSHQRLPGTLAYYDALLLPYADDEYNRGVIPAKFFECLATGKPVLASPLPALRGFADFIYFAATPRDWVETARNLNKTESDARRQARIAKAGEHTHDQVFSRLSAKMRQAERQKIPCPAAAPGPLPRPYRHLIAFAQGFSWISLFYGLARISTLLAQIAAGRWLGPAQYGKANLVLAAAAYLQILPIMGFPLALSKFISGETDEVRRGKIISTTFLTFLLWAGLWLAGLAAAGPALAQKFSIPPPLFELAVLFSYFAAFYAVATSPLLGLRRFEYRGRTEILYGVSVLLILAVFMTFGQARYQALILALCASLGIGAFYSLWAIRGYLRPVFDSGAFRLILRYALVATLNLLAGACISAPARLILHHYYSTQAVGVFSAYYNSTAQISLALLYMLAAVLVPIASKTEGQVELWTALKKIGPALFTGAWALLAAANLLALLIFGRQYHFHGNWVLIFSAAAALILIHGIAATLYSARDFSGLCISVAGNLIAGLSNAALALLLIPSWEIGGAALSLLAAHGLGLCFYGLCALDCFRGDSRR